MPEVDQLRGLAATLVLFYHGWHTIGTQLVGVLPFQRWSFPNNPLAAVIVEGHVGVGLFIVLSGFILTTGLAGRNVDYRSFMVSRTLRIYPMLVVCVLAAAALGATTLSQILTMLLPIRATDGIVSVFTTVSWSVAIEFQCYLLFPFLLAASNRRGSRFLLQMILVAILLRCLLVANDANAKDISYWTIFGRIDQFCIGMLLGRLWVTRPDLRLPRWTIVPAAALLMAALWLFNKSGGQPADHGWRLLWPTVEAGMLAFFIAAYIAAMKPFSRPLKAVTWIGTISYSVYLLHFPVITAVWEQGLVLHVTRDPYVDGLLTTMLIVLPLTVLAATLTYYTIEKPFMDMRSRYVKQPDPILVSTPLAANSAAA